MKVPSTHRLWLSLLFVVAVVHWWSIRNLYVLLPTPTTSRTAKRLHSHQGGSDVRGWRLPKETARLPFKETRGLSQFEVSDTSSFSSLLRKPRYFNRNATTRNHHAPTSNEKPLISFIIPSTLQRETLDRTIASLQKQTIPYWEAIVGIDVTIAATLDNTTTMTKSRPLDKKSTAFSYPTTDPRVRYVNITTDSADRGVSHNGAGQVRNEMMQHYATADWVAFCDDDDTLSPYYIEYWQQALQGSSQPQHQHQNQQIPTSSPDILIFRMRDGRPAKQFWYQGILPPRQHGPVASVAGVGISFAVRRSLVTASSRHNESLLSFVPGQAEDFDFLYQAQEKHHANILITCCVAYYVRSAPPANAPRQQCQFSKASIVNQDLRKVRSIPYPWNETAGVQSCPVPPKKTKRQSWWPVPWFKTFMW